MATVESRLSENSARIGKLETEVSDMKVEVGKMAVTVQQESKLQTERLANISTQTLELKDLVKARMERDEEREREARDYREKREVAERENQINRQKWIQSLFTPQTVILIVIIVLSAFGLRVSEGDFMTAISGGSKVNESEASE